MSSSPSSVKQRSPKRTSPKRTPLQERTQSQANELSSRLSKDARSDQENTSIYTTTPFPTKPAHVLLPSSIKRKKSAPGTAAEVFGFPFDIETGRRNEGQRTLRGGAQPTVRLKRSVKALRDLYEAQADDTSRPSTATSPPLRPSTASSARLRSISSSESLSGAFSWESFRKVSSDDLALLPTLTSGNHAPRRLSPRTSFTSIAERFAATSSPNYQVLGVTSSPRALTLHEFVTVAHDQFEEDPSSSIVQDSSSSPNIVRLAHTSSTEQFQPADVSSSPNVIKLGTSSPFASRPGAAAFSSISRSSSSSSRKRKRSDTIGSTQTFAARAGARNPLASSPPLDPYIPTSAAASIVSPDNRGFPSSAPQSIRHVEDSQDESSPVVRRLASSDLPSSDGSSLADTHASLQAALSSSPPRIQYPIVRAPPRSQQAGLLVPKRTSRSMSTDAAGPSFTSRLSAVPSETSRGIKTRSASVASSDLELDVDDYLHSDDLAPASAYIINEDYNPSQIRIVRDHESETHEASDEVSALPSSDDVYRSPLARSGSGSYIYSPTSSQQSRLNSMRSFTQLRHQNSFLSRPSSSASTSTATNALPLPTWAKRYYSGFYRDSFQYLYHSNSHVSLHSLAVSPTRTSRPQTSKSNGSPSRPRSFHQAMTERVEALFKSRSRPRLEARKSHTLPGIGPLVSNPIREPATAALADRRSSYTVPRSQSPASQNHSRSISAPLSLVDPRAHWAGVVEIHERPLGNGQGSSYTIHHHHYRRTSNGYTYSVSPSESQSVIYQPSAAQQGTTRHWSESPHLHHDQRLNTGSSVSRGFGFPFNTRSRWTAPSIITQSSGFVARTDLRTAQVACFAVGFVVPLTWFVAAFLPLPKRPASYYDLEKEAYANAHAHAHAHAHAQAQATNGQQRTSQRYSQPDEGLSDWEPMDVLARLRTERHLAGMAELKFQNARWWRNLNRWMCAVGVVVCVLIIVLAVLGTKRNW
ncbi:hypothetical protein PV05_02485 [Exophiala xenobiotica]|uniref:Serine-rich protein n=1 Tax=Exophiala xenobiotica TaxID=348802 RepID=A0A0D2FCZ1_9EURO|nr:uncharacterized protein PV05_02485 [Exophiala xenobiotica]KIW57929.1 hypothetical protein PV05_02485 [Exophiala xenobiotica]